LLGGNEMGDALVAGKRWVTCAGRQRSRDEQSRTSPILRRMGAARTDEEKNNTPPSSEPTSGAENGNPAQRGHVGWVWRAHMKRRTTPPIARTHQRCPEPKPRVTQPRRMGVARADEEKNNPPH